MRMTFAAAAAAATVLLAPLGTTAFAQGVSIGPGGVHIDTGGRISRGDARDIARRHGVRDIDEVDRDRGEYVVRGEDRRGRRMRVRIDARSGDVIEVVRRD